MTTEKLAKFLEENKNEKYFIITLDNGKKVEKRLFVTTDGAICQYLKRARGYGSYISEYEYSHWTNIAIKYTSDYNAQMVVRWMKNVIKYLDKSGAWPSMKESFEQFIAIPFEDIKYALENYNNRCEIYKKYGIEHSFCDSLVASAKIGIKTINYHSFNKDYRRNVIKEYIAKKEHFNERWHKGYDNTLESRYDEKENEYRIWYSEEYTNCGNGHYYFALDERHAIFCEND